MEPTKCWRTQRRQENRGFKTFLPLRVTHVLQGTICSFRRPLNVRLIHINSNSTTQALVLRGEAVLRH